MDKFTANNLLTKTKEDYNLIGYDFSSKRSHLTPDILYFKKNISPGDKILDLGCGNGRLIDLFQDTQVDYVGADTSQTMIKTAQAKYPHSRFVLYDGFDLPFADESFDKVFCLSVLHHVPSVPYRLKFLQEANRVLKKEGRLILTVWNLRDRKKARFLIIKNNLLKLFGVNKLDYNDIFLPFNISKDKNLTNRYLHCFRPKELNSIVNNAGFTISQSGSLVRGKKERNENLYTIARK